MPIYEYVCDDCNERYERIVLRQDAAVTCPKCASERHTIQLSVFAAHGGAKASGGPSGGATGGGGCCGGSCGCN